MEYDHDCFSQDYELQLVTYRAIAEPSSPMKKPKMDSASDNIIQEVRTLWPGTVCYALLLFVLFGVRSRTIWLLSGIYM